eukprot:1195182-Prorocentrum_minimum.AAC.2
MVDVACDIVTKCDKNLRATTKTTLGVPTAREPPLHCPRDIEYVKVLVEMSEPHLGLDSDIWRS